MAKELRFDVTALDQASKTFTRLGQAVERFEKRLDRLDGKRVSADVEVNTDKADREIGRFATDTRRKLQAALSNLPEIELDADSTPLDRKLADVRRRMAQLADKTIGVDLSAEEAIAEARLLHGELERLGRESPNIQVQTDIAAAMAQLAAVDAAVDRVDGRKATIKIDVDKSISETLIQVAQLGRALGALALPAAIVTAAPQIAALGAAAMDTVGALGLIPAVGFAAAGAVGALALGFQNFGDAVDTSDPEKAAEALGKLAPAARQTVLAVRELSGAWGELQQEVQQRLFEGVADDVKEIGGTYLPILRDGLGDVAEGLNYGAGQVAVYLRQWATTQQVTRLVDNTSNSVENLAASLAPVIAAVLDISEVGSAAFEELTRGAQDGAESFAAFIRSARDSGELRAWIDGGIASMGRLLSVTGNVGSLLSSVFEAGEQASGNFLVNADRVTEVMANWAGSAGGQQLLTGVFRGINDTVAALLPGIRDLGMAILTVIGMLAQSGVFTGFATALSSIMSAAAPLLTVLGALASTVLPPLLSAVSALAPVLVPLAAGLLAIRAASAGLDRLRTFGTNMGAARANVLGAISPMRQLSGEMRVQSALARQAGVSHAGLRGAVAAMANSQSAAASVVGQTAQAMAADYRRTATAVQGFADRAGASAQRAGDALGARLAAQVSRGVESIIRIPGAVADAGRRTATAAREMGRSLSTGLQTGVIYARETFRDLPTIADRAMERLRTSVYDGAVRASEALGNMAYDARRAYAIAADGAADMGRKVRDGAKSAMDALKDAGSRAVDTGKALGTGLRDGVRTAVTALRELPTTAVEAGRSLRTGLETGVIYARESLRQLPADAANAGRALATGLRTGVSAAGDAMRTFGTTVASGVRTAADGVANGLRSIPDRIQGAFSSLGSAASTAIGHLGRLAGAAAGAGRSIGSGLVRAGGSLVTFLGGPWGAALAAAGVALSILGERQAEAARKAQEHQAALDAIKGTLDSYTGATTDATRAEIAKQLAQDGSIDKLKQLGVNAGTYTDAMSGNRTAIDEVTQSLHGQTVAQIGASNQYRELKPILDAAGISLDTVALAAEGNVDAYNQIDRAIRGASSGGPEFLAMNQYARDGMIQAGGAAAEMQGRLNETAGALERQRTALQSAAAAASEFSRELSTVAPGLKAMADGASMTPQLKQHFDALSESAKNNAQSVAENALQFGNVKTAGNEAAAAMQKSRDQFIQAGIDAGMTREKATELADQLRMIPEQARIDFETNAATTTSQILDVNNRLREIPPGKTVTLDALTAPAQSALSALGITVKTLPNGKVEVTAPTEAAKANLDAFVRGANERKAEVKIDGQPQPAQNALAIVLSQIAAGKSQVNIDGNTVPAEQALAYLMGNVGSLKGDVQIGANKAPADQVLQAYIQAVQQGKGEVQIGANKIPADQVLAALVQQILMPTDKPIGATDAGAQGAVDNLNSLIQTPATKPMEGNNTGGLSANELLAGAVQQPATKPMLGDPSDAQAKDAAVRGAVQAPATKPMGGNNAAGMGAANALQVSAQAPATKPIGANDGGARGVVNSFIGWVAGLVATVKVVANKIGFAEGGILPMEHGGVVTHRVVPLANGNAGDPDTFDGHRLTPMAASTARIVPPKTYRVIGDNPQYDELYMPMNPSSGWSQTLLEIGANRMGRELLPKGMKLAPTAGAAVVPMANGGMVSAAQAILGRMRSGGQLFEDWTWKGAPSVVGQYNDALFDAMKRAGYRYADGRRFLEDYVRRASATTSAARVTVPTAASMKAQVQAAQAAKAVPTVTVQTGLDIAQLKAIHAQLVGLRGDLLTSGQWGPQMVDQLRGLADRLLRDLPATARAAAQRDLAQIGGWPT